MKNNKQVVFDIILSAFTSKKSRYSDEKCNPEKLYEFFKSQKIVPILYKAALLNKKLFSNEYFAKIKKEYKKSLFRQTLQDGEKKIIEAYFEENEIPYIVLKGDNIRKLYPAEDMRQSMDIDFMVRSVDYAKACEILKNLDFEYESETQYHTSFKKRPMVNVELHTMLCDPKLVVGFEKEFDVWNSAHKKSENSFEYELSNEDLYIYMLAHFAQHMMSSGAGLRCVIDLYLIIQKYGSEFDNDYLNERLNRFGFSKLAYACFEAGQIIFLKKTCENEQQVRFIDYLFDCGYTGTNENVRVLRIIEAGGKKSEIRRKTLPGRDAMQRQYPIIKKYKFLLPFCHALRIIKKSGKVFSFAQRIKTISKTNEEKIKKTNELYDYLGLEVYKGDS